MNNILTKKNNYDLKNKIIKGTSWIAFSQIINQLLSFGIIVVLARLLDPDDFGTVAISAVFVGFVGMLGNLGMGQAIIQRQKIDEYYLSTCFWTSFFSGIGIAIVLILISPFVSNYYHKDILKYIIIISSLSFIFGALTSTHITLLTKELEFNKIALLNIFRKVISGGTAIILAVYGFGVWSLVMGGLVASILILPIVWHLVKWRPKIIFRKKCFKDLFGFGSNLLAFNIFNYFSRNFDNLIIGKILGTQSLGYYSVAYNLMMKPLQHISWSIGRVLFPAFSSIQDDKERVKSAYLKVVRTISLITFPMMMGLMVVSKEFIITWYGSKWSPVIVPLQLLCVVGAFQSIGTTVGSIFTSQGRPDLQLKWGIFASTVCVIAFLIGIKWGLIGLIIAYMCATICLWPFSHYIANNLIGLKMKKFYETLIPAAISSVLMAFIIIIFKYINIKILNLNIYFTLIISIMLGIISYLTFVLSFFHIPEIREAQDFLRKKFANVYPVINNRFRPNKRKI